MNAHKIKPTVETYIIKYDLNGGEGDTPTSQIKKYGETIQLSSTKPTKKGYTFQGWATSQERANKEIVDYAAGADYIANAGATLYAVWKTNTIKEAKELGTKFEENRTLEDEKGNLVTIPGEFHIAKESGETVEDGIVIEDDIGNQFVWIPVSNIDGDNNISTTEKGSIPITKNNGDKVEITLGRYEFNITDGKGTPTLRQSGENRSASVIISGYGDYIESANNSRPNGGAGAKNLNTFVTSVKNNHGYYLARYEASYGSGNNINNYKPFVKQSKYNSISLMNYKAETLWNFITQGDASKVCQNMYSSGNESNYVESDLVNSYAWDTAIVYIQTMGNENYANANCATNGNEGILKNTGETGDKVCNIYDMAGNLNDWTTEYAMIARGSGNTPCVLRGGDYISSGVCTATRYSYNTTFNYPSVGFRPLIYIK